MKHKSADAIQKRLLWPTGKANRSTKDEDILGAAEATVRRVWEMRYGVKEWNWWKEEEERRECSREDGLLWEAEGEEGDGQEEDEDEDKSELFEVSEDENDDWGDADGRPEERDEG